MKTQFRRLASSLGTPPTSGVVVTRKLRGAVILSWLLVGSARLHLLPEHPWSNRSTAAYLDHVATFRSAKSLQRPSKSSWWDRFRPAFVCPWIDRLGRISDGGKWVCHWQALLVASPDAPPCVIYSFGVSDVRGWLPSPKSHTSSKSKGSLSHKATLWCRLPIRKRASKRRSWRACMAAPPAGSGALTPPCTAFPKTAA
jgi:hypothetical protein